MSQTYNNGILVSTGLHIENNTPADDRTVVGTFSDLDTIVYKYDGLITKVVDENAYYAYNLSTNTWNPFGSGGQDLQQTLENGSVGEVDTNIHINHVNGDAFSQMILADDLVAFQAGENSFSMSNDSAEIASNLAIGASENPNDAIQRQEVEALISDITGGSETLDEVLTNGNTSNQTIVLGSLSPVRTTYSEGGIQNERIGGESTSIGFISGASPSINFGRSSGTVLTSVSVNGGSPVFANNDGNVDLTVSGGGDFIPLSGTEEGSPVTGDIVLDDGITILPIENGALNVGSPLNGRMTFADDGQIIVSGPDNPSFVGISGGLDYSANNDGTDRKIYPQTGWVLDRLANGYIPLSGTEPDNPITGSLVFTEGNHIYSEVDINFGSPNYTYLKSQNTDTALIVAAGGDAVNPIGLTGNDDYSANNDGSDRKIYPQTGWVQDAIENSIGALPAVFRPAGNWNASGGTFPTIGTGISNAVRRGDTYNVSVAGIIGGESYDVGDNFYANVNAPGQTSGNWSRFETNTAQATDSYRGTMKLYTSTGTSTDGTMDRNSITNSLSALVVDAINDGVTTTAPSQNAVFDALALKGNLSGGNTWVNGQTFSNNATFNANPILNTNIAIQNTVSARWTLNAGSSSVAPTWTRNTADAVTTAIFNNANASNTGQIAEFQSGGTTLASITKAGYITAANILLGSAALDFPSTAANTTSDLTLTVTGAALGDSVFVGAPNAAVLAGVSYFGWVSATNTVTIRLTNISAVSVNPASATFNVRIIK